MPKKFKAKELIQLLKSKYPYGNGYVVLEQVPSGTGAYARSWIDAMVFSLWPSQGLIRSAYEVKVDRGDFLAELQNPIKNQWARDCCHEFWFLAPDGVIKEEELREGDGWIKPRGTGLSIVRHAAKKEDPVLDDVHLAAFMRAAFKQSKQWEDEALERSHDFRTAKAFQEGCERFLKERNATCYLSSADAVYKNCTEATLDEQMKVERQHILEGLDRFQNQLAELFEIFVVLAHISLLQRNEAGEFVTQCWGGVDKNSLEGIKQQIKSGSSSIYTTKGRKQKVRALESIHELARLFLNQEK